jgi:DNA-binding NtrC family response regulator
MNTTRTLTVLVVDDERLLRWALAELLRRHRHNVLEAESAEDARTVVSRTIEQIAVLFLDCGSPDSSNLALFADMRRSLPQTAIVLMTAFASPEVLQAADALGAYCVLHKPFDLAGIPALVREAPRR